MLHLEVILTITDNIVRLMYSRHGQYHRDDGPAQYFCIDRVGDEYMASAYFKYGKIHYVK
jgi:hypothetical protein